MPRGRRPPPARWLLPALCARLVAAVELPGAPARPLATELLLAFERQGHVATRGLLSQDVFAEVSAGLRAVAEEDRALAQAHAEEFASYAWDPEADAAEGGDPGQGEELQMTSPPFLQYFNPHRRHDVARRLAFSPALAATAAALLGVACVRLYQDCIFWKQGDHDATSWHADLWTAPVASNKAVTVWLPLHRVGEEDAPLYFQTGSHRDMAIYVHRDELGDAVDPPPGQFGEHHAPLEEGDATWHHGWTIHGAPPLEGGADGRGRMAYAATYFAEGATVLHSAAEPEDGPSYMDWLPEVPPGSPAVHELLPVAYPLEP